MDVLLSKSCGVAAVQRGQIIQRVLVDGWSTAQAAAAFGLQERRVARWVADYRRRGMASLHEDSAAEGFGQHWMYRVRVALPRWAAGLRRLFGRKERAPCVVLRRTGDEQGRHR